MAIVFYISGHGFGHASRDVEIINHLSSDQPVVIRSSVDPGLLKQTLRVPWELRPGPCDTGIVQATSIRHDDPATVRAARDFYATFDERVEAERQRLADVNVELIVGDIPPLAFAVAAALDVPSVAIGNFTWDWIYETHPGFLPDHRDVLALIRDCYRRVDLALELPFSGGFEIFSRIVRLPLVARQAGRSRAETRAHFGLPPDGRIALLSFGGYGLPTLDLSTLDCSDDWTIVTTDRVMRDGRALPHVHVLPEGSFVDSGFRYEDLVAAVDVVVTKPGYGIVAECISTGTALVYTSRGEFREYGVLVDAMPRYLRTAFISQEDLFAGRWRGALERVVALPPPPERMATDGAREAARQLENVLASAR